MPHTKPERAGPTLFLERMHLAWDLVIILLVIANLTLLLIDGLFLLTPLNDAFKAMAPGLHGAYDRHIHDNFVAIDLVFVAIFVLDVLLGWAVAIAERRYHRWFFYPFVHWYDVLGCIPVGGFRLLRILRVISLLQRLQRLGLIDIRQWRLYGIYAKYYDILIEELSDRIALRQLSSIQEQVRSSESLSQRIVDEVIMPRKQALIHEIFRRLEVMADSAYRANRDDLMRFINALVRRTLAESPEIKRLRRLPLGGQVASALDEALSDIAQRLVHEAIEGLHSVEFDSLVEHLADSSFDAWLTVDAHTDQVTNQVLLDTLELLKEQVAHQRWKQRYD
ncbi:ion transporter [Halomonas sp. DQ26W]|uniref:ion transporter n=1 Tax=Halomonas sp. DQ26W TaxID=2282311 RepID=UPI000DF7408A|nr:ion transporter [Halomonas sp. DQ26W]RDB41934.1 ion transporter [Halomonas sp. DQ26W]